MFCRRVYLLAYHKDGTDRADMHKKNLNTCKQSGSNAALLHSCVFAVNLDISLSDRLQVDSSRVADPEITNDCALVLCMIHHALKASGFLASHVVAAICTGALLFLGAGPDANLPQTHPHLCGVRSHFPATALLKDPL